MVVVVGVFRKYVREPSPPVPLSAAEGSGEEEESSSPSTSFANWTSSEATPLDSTPHREEEESSSAEAGQAGRTAGELATRIESRRPKKW